MVSLTNFWVIPSGCRRRKVTPDSKYGVGGSPAISPVSSGKDSPGEPGQAWFPAVSGVEEVEEYTDEEGGEGQDQDQVSTRHLRRLRKVIWKRPNTERLLGPQLSPLAPSDRVQRWVGSDGVLHSSPVTFEPACGIVPRWVAFSRGCAAVWLRAVRGPDPPAARASTRTRLKRSGQSESNVRLSPLQTEPSAHNLPTSMTVR